MTPLVIPQTIPARVRRKHYGDKLKRARRLLRRRQG